MILDIGYLFSFWLKCIMPGACECTLFKQLIFFNIQMYKNLAEQKIFMDFEESIATTSALCSGLFFFTTESLFGSTV